MNIVWEFHNKMINLVYKFHKTGLFYFLRILSRLLEKHLKFRSLVGRGVAKFFLGSKIFIYRFVLFVDSHDPVQIMFDDFSIRNFTKNILSFKIHS